MPAGSALSRREGSGGPGAAFQDGQGAQSYWGKSTFSTERGYHGRQKNPMIKIDARRAVENVRLWHDYCSGLAECLLSGVKQTLFPQPKMC
jgi:hypothetical protein